MEKVDTIVFDKTGTLTEGKPKVKSVHKLFGTTDETELLRITASLERLSEHPLANAIVNEALARRLQLSEPTNFRSIPGKGVMGEVEGTNVIVGNARFLREQGIALGTQIPALEDLTGNQGNTTLIVALDGHLVGVVTVADPIKTSTLAALNELKDSGTRLVMITGDSRAAAQEVANDLGIAEFEAEVLPGRKAEVVKRLHDEGRVVAMAGDGINDAPALAQADVGIAMGTGTDIAMESGGITLLKGDLEGIVRARRLSQATMRNIRQNLFFAFIYNSIGVPIAAGVLYPFFGVLLSPILAAAAMSFSSISVITNSLRLRNAKL